MPSSGIVAVDAANNDAAVIDVPTNSFAAEEQHPPVEQEAAEEYEEADKPALSPMPHKKAPMVTPKTDRKVTSETSNSNGNTNTSHTPVPSKGAAKKKVAVATPVDAEESTSPSKKSKKSKTVHVPMKTMKHFFGKAGAAKKATKDKGNSTSTKQQNKKEDVQPKTAHTEKSLAEPRDDGAGDTVVANKVVANKVEAKSTSSISTKAKAKVTEPKTKPSAKKKAKAAPKSSSVDTISVDMDDSPMDALAIVSRNMSAGRRNRTSKGASAANSNKHVGSKSEENGSHVKSSNDATIGLKTSPKSDETVSKVEVVSSEETAATKGEEAMSSSTVDNDGAELEDTNNQSAAAKEEVNEHCDSDDDATVAMDDSGISAAVESDDIAPAEQGDSVLKLPENEVEPSEDTAVEAETKSATCPAEKEKESAVIVIDEPTPETNTTKKDDPKKKAEATKKKRDPNAPKKPKSALNLFQMAKRNEFKAANPNAKAGEITKLMSAEYKKLDAEAKSTWEEQAKEDKVRYEKEMATYKPPDQLSSTENIDKKAVPKDKPAASKGQSPILKALASCPPKSKGDSSTKVTKKATPMPTPKAKPVLSEEDLARISKFNALKDKYNLRAVQLTTRPASDDFVEENLDVDNADLPSLEKGSVDFEGTFPDQLLPHLMVIAQGSSLPLSTLAEEALQKLSIYVNELHFLTLEVVSSKIKLVAQRKSFLNAPSQIDCFENNEESYMWRWELSSTDLLPSKDATKVKKARAVRKKLQSHHKAITNLISAIDKAVSSIETSSSSSQKLVAKVSDMEEKVLKFEREEETARLLNQAKAKKQVEDNAKKEEEKARKEAEKERKKVEAAKEREEAKQRKAEEKEKEKMAKQQELEEKENKRKARMMSFFSKGSAKKKQKTSSILPQEDTIVSKDTSSFDSASFHRSIDSEHKHAFPPFSKASRKRKTKNVRVSVFVTAMSDNPFSQQPYDEEKIITVPNMYKFLGFHEDVRPPYWGTWSKTSSIITGRNPFGKDTAALDYEVDSEAEWEEGDDDQGEDLNEDVGDEEEDEVPQDEDNDGWLAAEDDLGIDDEDEETRELRKRKFHLEANLQRSGHYKACIVAPQIGGIPHDGDCEISLVDGFSLTDALVVLSTHVSCVLSPEIDTICLDAFVPTDSNKNTDQTKDSAAGQSDEMSNEAKKIVAQFVHNSTVNSKDKLLTELLKTHPSITKSRAQAMRELDFMAEKKKVPKEAGGGVVWEVKSDLLKTLGLREEDLKQPPQVTAILSPKPKGNNASGDALPNTKDSGSKPSEKKKKKKDPNAPKKPKSSFVYFSNAKRHEVKAANPEASAGEINKLLGIEWKKLSNGDKSGYEAQAELDKKRYQDEMKDYKPPIENSDVDNVDDKKEKPEVKEGQQLQTSKSTPSPSVLTSPGVSSSTKKKRKTPSVSAASVDLFAAFLKKKKTE